MKKAIILTGIQASGKTSFYEKKFKDSNCIYINLDTLKTRKKEQAILEQAIKTNSSFIVDNTNPTKNERKRYIEIAKQAGYQIIGYYFKSSIDVCIERNSKRNRDIPNKAIANTFNRLELPSFNEGFDRLYYVSIEENEFKIQDWSE